MYCPEALMVPETHPAEPVSVGRPCAAPKADHVIPESEERKRLFVVSDTMSWYWPVEDVPSFLTPVIDDFAVCQAPAR
jgi:hypothetical protein